MSVVTNSATSAGTTSGAQAKDALADVDVNQFLKLMIAELQNQDPLNPLDNAQMIAQIGELRSISSTDKLTSTLDSVLLGQNIASATGLIGSRIEAVSDDNQAVTGIVDRVGVEKGVPKLYLDLQVAANPHIAEGSIEKGTYEYRVVWRDTNGKLFAVDPLEEAEGKAIELSGELEGGQAVLISNLPKSDSAKEVYRRKKGVGEFQLVGSIADKTKATFLDTASTADASTALVGVPNMISNATREFLVSLNNVGEIRRLEAEETAAASAAE